MLCDWNRTRPPCIHPPSILPSVTLKTQHHSLKHQEQFDNSKHCKTKPDGKLPVRAGYTREVLILQLDVIRWNNIHSEITNSLAYLDMFQYVSDWFVQLDSISSVDRSRNNLRTNEASVPAGIVGTGNRTASLWKKLWAEESMEVGIRNEEHMSHAFNWSNWMHNSNYWQLISRVLADN